ncbi:DUF1360 domain-containing protein [Bacillus solitudinis]|uniref:DUF1360 domain-containing protein n=1 Tax=Bacillus solitudinis TaxID=2014074 RepID=UPI000C231BB8|nr:DUF1360 domain-containing protein [Bacillus solitudinis]
MQIFDFFLLVLASFRLTRLFMYDTITEFIRRPFHSIVEETLADGTTESFLQIKGSGLRYWIGQLLSCYWCFGIWCTAFLFLGYLWLSNFFMPIIIILAIAGSASIIEAVVEHILN